MTTNQHIAQAVIHGKKTVARQSIARTNPLQLEAEARVSNNARW